MIGAAAKSLKSYMNFDLVVVDEAAQVALITLITLITLIALIALITLMTLITLVIYWHMGNQMSI